MMRPHEIPPVQHGLPALRSALPVLETARLSLRVMQLGDLPLLAQINEEVSDKSLRSTDAWEDFVQMTATWVFRGHGWFTVSDADIPVGFVGLGFEPGDKEPELGYLFAAAFHGKGYATEAAAAVRNWGFQTAGLVSLVSYVSHTNAASQNVARKLGATRDAAAEAALGEDGAQVWRHPHPKETRT